MDAEEAKSGNEISAIVPFKEENAEQKKMQSAEEEEIQIAGCTVRIVQMRLEHPLTSMDIKMVLYKCLNTTVLTCRYCNHANKIAVSGKQLALHAISKHRFSAFVKSITGQKINPESFVARIRQGLPELQGLYFSLESLSTGRRVVSDTFYCSLCRFSTAIHNQLYMHSRNKHSTVVCAMCKSSYYSYGEFLCHLCPGITESNEPIRFRCYLCLAKTLPSAFRLLVHLRKQHNVCDVCLEFCADQLQLSLHVNKHNANHLCYRCNVTYMKKYDIACHMFWKHDSETVICKKCVKKRWPYSYHFCIPPKTFKCDECGMNFSKAIPLVVHKRIHTGEKPHECKIGDCNERFISKNLLLRHQVKHKKQLQEEPDTSFDVTDSEDEELFAEVEEREPEIVQEKPKQNLKFLVDGDDYPVIHIPDPNTNASVVESYSKNGVTMEKAVYPELKPKNMDTQGRPPPALKNDSMYNQEYKGTAEDDGDVFSDIDLETLTDELYLNTSASDTDEDFYDSEQPAGFPVYTYRPLSFNLLQSSELNGETANFTASTSSDGSQNLSLAKPRKFKKKIKCDSSTDEDDMKPPSKYCKLYTVTTLAPPSNRSLMTVPPILIRATNCSEKKRDSDYVTSTDSSNSDEE